MHWPASPRSTGDAVAESHQFGRALTALARETGLRRFVVGGAGSLKLPNGEPVLSVLPDLYKAEATGFRDLRDTLKASDLDWTFFSPAIEMHPGTAGIRKGTYRTDFESPVFDDDGRSVLSVEDVAVALVDELENNHFIKKRFTAAY